MHRKIAEICAGIRWLIVGFFLKKRLLTTFLYSFLFGGTLLVDAQFRKAPYCKIFKVGDVIVGDCSMQGLSLGIPQDLDGNVNVLNLSSNNLQKITNRSFLRYRDSLTTLDMSGLGKAGNKIILEKGSFFPLSKLQYLDMSQSCWSNTFMLPSNIRVLRIENCSTILDIDHLQELESFHAAGNNWTETPIFHKFAPLKLIDLRRNPISKFEVEKIASYCELRIFRLDPFPAKSLPESFHSISSYCACKRVDDWLTHVEIEHETIDCTAPKGITPNCDLAPSEESLQLRNECLERLRVSRTSQSAIETNWRLITIGVLIMLCILLPILTLVITGLKRRTNKKKANKKKRPRRTRDEGVQYEGGDEEYEEEWQETDEDGYYHCC